MFDEKFFIESSFECRFDHIEVRDGPFSFSPLINRFCGSLSPGLVLSSGRFMWIRFFSDDELEGIGFKVQYNFTPGQQRVATRACPPPGAALRNLLSRQRGKNPKQRSKSHFLFLPPLKTRTSTCMLEDSSIQSQVGSEPRGRPCL